MSEFRTNIRPGLRPGKISRPDGMELIILPRSVIHMAAHADVTFSLLHEAFQKVDLSWTPTGLKQEIDLKRIIGHTAKLATAPIAPSADTTFAYRHGRRYPTRVVMPGLKLKTSLIVIVAKRDWRCGDAAWVLESAYLGSDAPVEPLGNQARKTPDSQARSIDYWCRHALVFDPREYVTQPFTTSWDRLIARRMQLGAGAFPEGGPYWIGD